MLIITTLHDPEGKMLPLIVKYFLKLKNISGKVVIACTNDVPSKLINRLKELNFEIVVGGGYGEGRREALKVALKKDVDNEIFFCCDFDKILHWLKVEPGEFENLFGTEKISDFMLLGRSKKVFNTYPNSWKDTEGAVNNIFSKKIGKRVDTMCGTYIFNRKCAEVIVRIAKEKSWGAAIEWPVLILKDHLKLRYKNARGLTWEDPDRNEKEIEKLGYRNWLELYFDGTKEWKKRFNNANEQLIVLENFDND